MCARPIGGLTRQSFSIADGLTLEGWNRKSALKSCVCSRSGVIWDTRSLRAELKNLRPLWSEGIGGSSVFFNPPEGKFLPLEEISTRPKGKIFKNLPLEETFFWSSEDISEEFRDLNIFEGKKSRENRNRDEL